MNLIESLQTVEDPRRLQGQRYSCTSILILIILSMLRNKHQYREIARLCELNRQEIVRLFGFKSGKAPSHVTFRSFIQQSDFRSLQTAFYQWAKDYVDIEEGEWISIDGKCIRSTVSDPDNQYQNFVSLVSLFSRKREQVLYAEKLENKKGNESKTVEELLDILDLKGAILTLDALHCKKNATKNRKKRKSLPCQSQSKST